MPAPYPAPPGSSVNSIPGSMQSNNGGMPGMNNSNGGMPGMMNNMKRQFPPTFSQPNSMVYLQNPMAGNNMGVTPGQGLPPAPTPNGASQTREALPSPVKQAPTPMGAAPMGAVPAGAGQVGVGSVDAAEKARRDTEKVAKYVQCILTAMRFNARTRSPELDACSTGTSRVADSTSKDGLSASLFSLCGCSRVCSRSVALLPLPRDACR
eukprot:3428515-Rhodomonas_salina.3